MASPICEEETMIILSSVDRHVGERSNMRSTTVKHLQLIVIQPRAS
jgi:hypothetical protein